MSNYNTAELPSGLRVIHQPSASPVVYCGIAVKAGTRHEATGQEGLAHFCEHMAFKGTQRRSAVKIINEIEGVGGELNAFTNKEDTVYYCAVSRQHFRRAVDVLCDIVFCSTYPLAEVVKEREVVCDEIESYEDTPAELIYDEFENLLFEGHPLGHNILGSSQQVRGYQDTDAQAFAHRWYRPENCVFFVSGDVDFAKLVKQLGGISGGTWASEATGTTGATEATETTGNSGSYQAEVVRHRGTHQAHVMIGTKAFSANDGRRWALYLLNNILGGPGMNSRLNLTLRERYGLVYSVDSSMVCYGDTGLWMVYFGCDPHDVARCRRLVAKQLNRFCTRQLSASQLSAAKRQLQGQLTIACDNREQFALDFARNYLHSGKLRDLTNISHYIDRLTSEDILQVACQVFDPNKLTTLIYE